MSSIFLSHNSNDKTFVRKLANDLRRNGFYVWVDEAEIKLGDSLIEKIREGLDRVEYVGVILSKNSINSEWVKREIDIAMNQEIEGKKVRVLPIMLEKVEMPSFLKGKLYADFSSEELYKTGLEMIIDRLSENINNDTSTNLSKTEVDIYLKMIDELKIELNVTRGERRLLMERLEKERRNMSEHLSDVILSEEKFLPEFLDINKYYAFESSGVSVTAGYILHALRKEYIKGGPHQIVALCQINNQLDELSILLEAVLRRLHNLKDFSKIL